jgi:ribosomal protein S18 acetylase RimI-like enzyme
MKDDIVTFRPMRQDDDTTAVARLVYGTDPDLFRMMFGRPKTAIRRLSGLIGRTGTSFSHTHITLATGTSGILGLMIAFDPGTTKESEHDFLKACGFWGMLRLMAVSFILFPVLSANGIKGRYIQNISVDPDQRGKGIGTALLKDAEEKARDDGIKTLSLDVSRKNDGARTLYRRMGFEETKTKRAWGIVPVTVRLEKTL